MKICFVLGHELPFPPKQGGGVNSLLFGLCKGLVRNGHEVVVYSPSFDDYPNEEIEYGIKHIRVQGNERVKSNYLNQVVGIPYALRVYNKLEECDVLSCHLWHGFIFSFVKKAKLKTHTIHRDPKKFLLLFSLFDRIYSGSESISVDAQNLLPNLSNKFKSIYNCVDYTGYDLPITRKRDSKIRFLFVGRFSSDKGLESLIEGFIKIALINKSIELHTVGPMTEIGGGEPLLVEKMKKLISKNNIEDQIQFHLPIYDRLELDQFISKFDVIVLSSITGETLNMSILECLRLGKALLISDLEANKPLNIDDKTGYFVRAGDADDWADKIKLMSSDILKIEEFGINAYNYGKENFSCDKIALNYIDDYNDLFRLKK